MFVNVAVNIYDKVNELAPPSQDTLVFVFVNFPVDVLNYV